MAGLLVLNTIVNTLSSIPQVTLQGENLGYKRMGMSVILVLAGGCFTWLALYFKTGIVGVAAAVVTSTLATGLFYLWVVKLHAVVWCCKTADYRCPSNAGAELVVHGLEFGNDPAAGK